MNETTTTLASLLNLTVSTTPNTLVPSNYAGLKFGEDGVRQPPSFVASNNVVIMVLGLSLLIVPVVGLLVCMIAKSRVLKNLRGMKLVSDRAESGLPYSQFDSEEPEDYESLPHHISRKETTNVPKKDFRVLVNNDNTVIGTPTKSRLSDNDNENDALSDAIKVLPSTSKAKTRRGAPLDDDSIATLDVDATFITPLSGGSHSHSSHT